VGQKELALLQRRGDRIDYAGQSRCNKSFQKTKSSEGEEGNKKMALLQSNNRKSKDENGDKIRWRWKRRKAHKIFVRVQPLKKKM